MLHNPDKKADIAGEESKQIKEPGTQVSSQLTGKLIFKLSKLIYQNYLTFGRRDIHGLSNFTCLVLGYYKQDRHC